MCMEEMHSSFAAFNLPSSALCYLTDDVIVLRMDDGDEDNEVEQSTINHDSNLLVEEGTADEEPEHSTAAKPTKTLK